MENVTVAVQRRPEDLGYCFNVELTVPAAQVPKMAAAVAVIAEADTLTAGDIWQFGPAAGRVYLSDFCFDYAGKWWLCGELGGAHAYTPFAIAAEGENIKISLQMWRKSAGGLDHTTLVDPNLWWVDAAAMFKELLNSGWEQ